MTKDQITTPIGKGLAAAKLRAALNPAKISFSDSSEIPDKNGYSKFQPRAIQAIKLALSIPGNEFNIFLAGEANMGRTYFVREVLKPEADKAPASPDWIYVHNFENLDRPLAISMPAGQGRKFKSDLASTIEDVRADIPARIDQDSFSQKHDSLYKVYNRDRDALYRSMEDKASSKDFLLKMDDNGAITLSPIKDGQPLSDELFETLPQNERQRLKSIGDELLSAIGKVLRKMHQLDQTLKKDELELRRKAARASLDEHFADICEKYGKCDKMNAHLKAMRDDMVENVEHFLPKELQQTPPGLPQLEAQATDDHFNKYEVNLFVDNSGLKGAPVVVENHPTGFNLLGSIEREAELGAFYTDFSLVKAGSLHRANHGFLIVNMEDMLVNASAWDGLLRSLRTGSSAVEDPVDPDQARTKTIEPEPIPLNLKIVLIGTYETFEVLLYHDDRFQKYFKLTAQLQHSAKRNSANERHYISVMGRIIREAGILPFTRDALAGLVDYGSRLAEDQKRLSLYFPLLRERMIEASAMAAMDGKKQVDSGYLDQALCARDFRANLFEEEYMGDYEREVIKVPTMGQGVGRANGLSVTMYGDHEFGLPHQISCTVGVGHGGILDLEREAQLGGPIHTKGMMIIKSYLVGLFAQDKPIVMTGSLCFEQSYAGIEGDSASGAELAALLSALANTPINLSLAFTGAVSQSGAIMAVGGVNRKIEGFFEVCRRRGLTGKQGVLLPADNVVNLMLKDEVVQAVEKGDFHIFAVKSVEEAMSILTGLPAGKRSAKGKFPKNTLFGRVDSRLAELAALAEKRDGK